MSIVRVRNGKIAEDLMPTSDVPSEVLYPVEACPICGENLFRGDFVFWSGTKQFGYHPECARHMALGLLTDIARLGISLSHPPYPQK